MMKIVDVIRYEGDNNSFVWKHPCEDFNKFSQLIVNESQEALLFKNGQALDLFGPGRYTLDTENLPVLKRLVGAVTGGSTPFQSEVYFINKTVQMGVKWGTDSKVRFIEPLHGIPCEIGASGELNLQVVDSRKLIVKLVGSTGGIAWEEENANFTKSLINCFRPFILTAVKAHLSSSIKENNINILEIDEHLEALSETLRNKINPGFEEYGLTIPQLYISNIVLPEDDQNFKNLRTLYTTTLRTDMAAAQATVTAAQRQVSREEQATELEAAKHQAEMEVIAAQAKAQASKIEGFAEAEVMKAKGYNQKDVLQAEVQKAYAEGLGNMGANGGGGAAGEIIGLGVGMAAIGAVGNQASEMFSNFGADAPAKKNTCNSCGAVLPENSKFCLECGAKAVALGDNEIICPACNNKVPKAKFCLECGSPLVAKCKSCGAEAPVGSKFCMECGEKF